MKYITLLLAFILLSVGRTFGEDLDGRSAFLSAPGRDVSQALKRAEQEKKKVLVFVVNTAKKQAGHLIGTMEVPETKKLVHDNFVVVIVTNPHEKHVAGLVDDVVPIHPSYVVFKADGTVLEKGDAAMGGNNGLNWIKKLVATP
ncbi:MAG TPA: hypothetical protein VK961_05870 [Chthoniobacter sp.]|nr:hypothetical protein [Chthoniobacter sp.]